MKNLIILLVMLFSMMQSNVTTATPATDTPQQVIESAGNSLFARIASNQDALQKFPELMRDIVEEELMPSVDHQYAAFKILGRHLRSTSQEQRVNFVNAMRSYLVRTYANALTQYTNQKVIYEPASPLAANARAASVNIKIVDNNRPDIRITFQMRKDRNTQQWRAYDMVVEGISLISSKQAEFNRKIASFGLDQVTLELASISK
ncbi:phospholipid transport system substrate-binding protein [Colwellia chukchiensis]|uniref:Phospholipid transport system substrate-binding protein n=1 Tax=Colwellia chukchiensis TaxID=641665 RepID=A0A1H7GYA6_9GAMM|nr:ABC transporter substrate-binding protein [Colwellia chukchiensis]SEK43004.1 phospholipid transport system substrate-binding protein [Colwellia chukchiensis]